MERMDSSDPMHRPALRPFVRSTAEEAITLHCLVDDDEAAIFYSSIENSASRSDYNREIGKLVQMEAASENDFHDKQDHADFESKSDTLSELHDQNCTSICNEQLDDHA